MISELRPYPAYRDSCLDWLGKIPEHWEVRRLKNIFRRIVGGSTPQSSEPAYWDGDIVWVTPTDVSRMDRLFASERRITREGLSSCSAELVPPGSIIVTSRAPVGNVAVAETQLCTNQGCKALVPNDRVVETSFAFEVLKVLKPQLQSLAAGTTFMEISAVKLGAISVAIPPIPEQVAIVRFLNYVDRRIRRYIRAKQKLIALLNEQKQVIVQQAVTQGLDPNVRLKPSGVEWLGDVPESWDIRPAKLFFREVDQRSTTGDEELLSVSHITGVTPRSQKNVTMFMAESCAGYKLCEPGDLVINTMWAWMGALGISRQTGIVSPSYAVYRPVNGSGMLPEYANLLLRTRPYISEYFCRSTGVQASRLRLYPDQFLRIKLICPSQEEQMGILARVETETFFVERAIAKTQRDADLLREYRTSLIADVVTGKLDVREAAAKLSEETEEADPIDDTNVLAGDDERDDVEEDSVAGSEEAGA